MNFFLSLPAAIKDCFAVNLLKESLEQQGHRTSTNDRTGNTIKLVIDTSVVPDPEGYRLGQEGHTIHIIGGSANGLKFGVLSLMEHVQSSDSPAIAHPREECPDLPFRAFKCNLPWDSYRLGEAMRANVETCRDPRFWTALLDHLARCRFNALTLWNLHPFPYMVQCPDFPEASPFTSEEMAEWHKLWSHIFTEASYRGIQTYIIWWNIFVPDGFREKYGSTPKVPLHLAGIGDDRPVVKDYTRQCIEQLIETYPELTGIGVSLGERMGKMSPQARQDWVEDVVFPVLRTASRPVKFIHRAPFTTDPAILRSSVEKADLPGETIVEMKFNWSHGHSSPNLCMTHNAERGKDRDVKLLPRDYWEPAPKSYKMAWMVRNEDFFVLRWGQPEFIRQHIRTNGHPYVAGYFVGSEGYIPALELAVSPEHPNRNWTYAFERQWLFTFAWGRLLYNNSTSDDVFVRELARRYGPRAAPLLFEGLSLGSRMPLRLASFYAGTWDYSLYSEGFLAPFSSVGPFDTESNLISVEDLMAHDTLDDSLMSIKEYVKWKLTRATEEARQTTPLQLADDLVADARRIEQIVAELEALEGVSNKAFAFECTDIAMWGDLSRYFAEKLRGATALLLYREMGNTEDQQRAIGHLRNCSAIWKTLSNRARKVYHPIALFETVDKGALRFHWANLQNDVDRDVAIAEGRIEATLESPKGP